MKGLVALGCAALACSCMAGAYLELPSRRGLSRAMWVWSSPSVLGNAAARDALLAFSRQQALDTLWMQVTTQRAPGRRDGTLQVSRQAEWRQLLAAAHEQGLRIEALDGDPTYADAAFHEIPLAITDALVAFNRDGPPRARFDGVHFDNEPYLLPGWHDPPTRERLLQDYLTLNDEIQRRARAGGMTFAVDLPFWWSVPDPATGEPIAAVTYQGRRLSAAAHALERLDEVTAMDYRNESAGADGLVALATPLLLESAKAGHARVRVGIETAPSEGARVWFAIGPAIGSARQTLGRSWRRNPGDPFRLRSVADGTRVHLGVEWDRVAQEPPAALVEIIRDYGVAAGDVVDLGPTRNALVSSGEWQDVEAAPIRDPVSGRTYAGFTARYVPQAKLTFATRPRALREELAAADRAFRQFAPYTGLAVHHYDAFKDLVASTTDRD